MLYVGIARKTAPKYIDKQIEERKTKLCKDVYFKTKKFVAKLFGSPFVLGDIHLFIFVLLEIL